MSAEPRPDPPARTETSGVSHIVSHLVQVGPYRRQRCVWCGAVILDEDLSRMSWKLAEDGTDPGPGNGWEAGGVVEIDGSMTRVIPGEEWPLSADGSGDRALPANCCARLDPEATR